MEMSFSLPTTALSYAVGRSGLQSRTRFMSSLVKGYRTILKQHGPQGESISLSVQTTGGAVFPPDKNTVSAEAVQTVKEGATSFAMFVKKVTNDGWLISSAALAYTLLFSAFPIFLVLLALLGVVLGQFSPSATTALVHGIVQQLPSQLHVSDLIAAMDAELQHSSGLLGLIALVSSLFFGSQLFIVLETCFSIIYRVRPRSLIRQQVVALALFLLFLLLVPAMVFTASTPALVFSLVHHTPLGNLPFLRLAISPLGGFLASFLLFESIYVLVPNMRIRLRRGALGALIAAMALQLYLALFSLYATYFLSSMPGVAGLVALLLIFFYYFAVILLLGAEVNAFFVEGVRPLPNDVVTFATTIAGNLNQDMPEKEAPTHVDTRPTEQAYKEHALDGVSQTEERDEA
jgi:YihY family inner membrane protein